MKVYILEEHDHDHFRHTRRILRIFKNKQIAESFMNDLDDKNIGIYYSLSEYELTE